MGSTSKVDQMMQMMVTLLLAVIAIISIPKMVSFIFGDDEEEGAKVKAKAKDEAAKKRDIDRKKKVLMKGGESDKDKGTTTIIREGEALMKEVAQIPTFESHQKITEYVETRIKNASDSYSSSRRLLMEAVNETKATNAYSMEYKGKGCVTRFDKHSAINNEYIKLDESTQMVTAVEWCNGKGITAFTKPKCQKDSIHCCFFKIIRTGKGYKGKTGVVYIGIMPDKGNKADSYMIDLPTASANAHLCSTANDYYNKKGKIHFDNCGIDEGDVIKVVVDQNSKFGIISFINMTKSTKDKVRVAAFRMGNKSLSYRFVAVLIHKGDACQIVNGPTEYNAEAEAKRAAVSAGNTILRIGGWSKN